MKYFSYLGIFLCFCFIQSQPLQAQSFKEKLDAAKKVIGKEFCHTDALAFAKMVGKDEHVFEKAIQRLLVEEPELCWDETENEGRLKPEQNSWPYSLNVNVLVKNCRFYISYIRFNVGDDFSHCELSEDNTELPIISESSQLERSFTVNDETQIDQLVEYSDPNDSPKVWKKKAIEEYEACHGKLPRNAQIISSILFKLNEDESSLQEASGDNCLSPLYQFQNSTLYRAIGEHVVELDAYLNSASIEKFERDSVPTDEVFRNELIARWSQYDVYRADLYKGSRSFYGLAHGKNTAGRSADYFLEGNFVLGLPHGTMRVTSGESLSDDLLFNYGEDITYRDTVEVDDNVFYASLDDSGNILDGPVIVKTKDGSLVRTLFEDRKPKTFVNRYYPDSTYYIGEFDDEYEPHGKGTFRFRSDGKKGVFLIEGSFAHGKPYLDSLYKIHSGDFVLHSNIDENFLPHSPEEFSVYGIGRIYEEDEVWVSFNHGEPGKAIIQYKSNSYAPQNKIKPKDYLGEVNQKLEPSGIGKMTVYESGTDLNFYEGRFYSGDPSKKEGKWRYEPFSRGWAQQQAREDQYNSLVNSAKSRYSATLEKVSNTAANGVGTNRVFVTRSVSDFDKYVMVVVIDKNKNAGSVVSTASLYKNGARFTRIADIVENYTLTPNKDGYPYVAIRIPPLDDEELAAAKQLGISQQIIRITTSNVLADLEIYIANEK